MSVNKLNGDDDECPNSCVRKEGKERGELKGEHGRILGEEEGNADYGRMVQPSQHHFALCVKMG